MYGYPQFGKAGIRMKRIRWFLLMTMVLLVAITNASAIHMESNGNSWFLPDGRIVQTKKVFTGNGSEYPGLLCYNQNGELLWEHTFRTAAIGRSYCQLTDDDTIAFMYYDQNHQYFIEYFNTNGEFVAKNTRELHTTDGMLYENGAVFCEKLPEQKGYVLSIRHWNESGKRWQFQGAEKMKLYSVESHGNGVCIELNMQSSKKSAHSILFVDATDDIVRWEYRLDTDLLKAYAGNEQGGITLFVQKDAPNDQYKLEMITLDAYGNENLRAKVDGIPATIAINVVSEQENGLYTIWGYGYDTYGENKVICASLNAQGEVVERKDIPTDYATCVRYLNDEIYVMDYENGIESFRLIPFEELANKQANRSRGKTAPVCL